MNHAKRKRGIKGWAITLGVLVGLFVIAGVAYAFDVAANQGKIPRAVSVGGVDISSMERRDAVAKLQQELGGAESQQVQVTAGEKTTQFVPNQAGLSLDIEQAVAGIPDASMNPFARVYSFFKPTTEYPVDTQVDQAALVPVMQRIEGELNEAPKDGSVGFEAGKVKVVDAVVGQKIDPAQLEESMKTMWLDPEGIELETTEEQPLIGEDQVKDMAEGEAAAAVDGPLILRGRNDVTAELSPEQIASFLRVDTEGDRLGLIVDEAVAQEKFAEILSVTEKQKVNAQISFVGGSKSITPHVDGEVIDWEATMADFRKRVVGDQDREWDAEYKDEPATFTTEDAENASFNDVIGEFSTSGFSGPSGTNIALTANIVNGAIVAPGDVFSLNGYTGPRGTAQGFVESGIIINGRAGEAVGGGISQFATTLYNASYFAGMEDVAHTAHSYYISRYPAGREATVYEGAIDLQFRNTSQYPVMIESFVDGNTVTVRLKGVKTVNVESIPGGQWAPTQPETQQLSGDDCIPTSGIPGFTTSDTRVITDLNGNEISRETTTTVYDPQPIVTCS